MQLPARLSRLEIEHFLRFAIVGGVGFLIDAGLLFVFLRAGLDPFVARSISLPVAAFSTWRLNRRITFTGSGRSQATEGVRYAVVAALTAVFNYLVYALALTLWPSLPPVAVAVGATLMAMGFSYVGYSRFVFSSEARAAVAVPMSQRR
jgi:putative flippase GtrA